MEWTTGQTRRIFVGNHWLETACYGPKPNDAATIVLLHEGLGCLELWRDFPRALAARTSCGVLAYSRAGYGHSDPIALPRPIDYMTREAEGPLAEIIAQMGLRQMVLMGHSDGATIAAIYAGQVRDARLRGIVLMAPHFFCEPMGLDAIAEARIAYERGDLRTRLAKYHADPDMAFRGWHDVWLHPEFRDWNIGEVIDMWRVRCLAIQGAEDQYGTLAQIEEIETRSFVPVQTVLLDGCRHAPHVDRTDIVLERVARFVQPLIAPA